ncbi:MAG: phosphoenolpyruvate carboxykinase [Geminicoccaceae bacterium]|nr:phosphoenolpyruvate carboxykinase [Geminicoccaceae bacterium]
MVEQVGPVISRFGLEDLGLEAPGTVHWNLPTAPLVEHALRRGEGRLVTGGALACETGHYTGRSPKDKFILDEPGVREAIDWGEVNQPLAKDTLARVWRKARAHAAGRDLFVQDLYGGADPAYRLPVRVITEYAWHSMFARNMFIRPSASELGDFQPGFTVLDLATLKLDPESDGTRSETLIAVDFSSRIILIVGTRYAGEIKKSIFGVLNFILPDQGVMPMHCSANIGERGDVAIFFGLSGTGKTTLSADPARTLIGDDEHGWSDRGIFNFEGGCYAKVIRLREAEEPEIFKASTRFGAILENVVFDPVSGRIDFDDDQLTVNTRSSYPLDFIPNASRDGQAGHPDHIVMLTADAFGVLPPISKLTPQQAMYHFLSGYTARIAGTERGVSEPQATFSTCFGAPFMPRHPTVYGEMLRECMHQHDATCWLVNTGWSGGAHGTGERMSLKHTRAMLRAALDGDLAKVEMREDPTFGLAIPTSCPGVPEEILNPRTAWADKEAYDRTARELAGRFAANFERFEPYVDKDVKAAAIRPAA